MLKQKTIQQPGCRGNRTEFFLISKMCKLKLRKSKLFAQGHTVSPRRYQDLNLIRVHIPLLLGQGTPSEAMVNGECQGSNRWTDEENMPLCF